MMFNSHEEEERLLRDAKRLRKQAQAMREARLKEREKAEEQLRKGAAKAEVKRKRDEGIRAFLLPLAEAFERTGWRIKTPTGSPHDPVFVLTRSNQWPAEEVKIYWKNPDFTNQMGFYWE